MFARLDRSDGSRELTGAVCYCCKTAIATDAADGVYTAWRHVYEGNVRDVAFTKSSDNGRTFALPIRVSNDNWVLDGCPENGPALAVDDAKRIHVVWPTLVAGATPTSEPALALFYAMSLDGRRVTARQRIPTEGFPRHPRSRSVPAASLSSRGTNRPTEHVALRSLAALSIAREYRDSRGNRSATPHEPSTLSSRASLTGRWSHGPAARSDKL